PHTDRAHQVVFPHDRCVFHKKNREKRENLRSPPLPPPPAAHPPPMSVNGIVLENQQQLTRPQAARPPRISTLRHSRCREKSRASQRKINAVLMQFWQAIGILHQPLPRRGQLSNGGRPMSGQSTTLAKHHQQGTIGKARTTCAGLAYSITSSARASSVGGTSKPKALAVFRLPPNSNLVPCCTGRSAGFAPLRILSTKLAERFHMSLMLAE